MKVFNNLTKRKEEFVPVEKGKVNMYVCGPTVYDYIHIGNARSFVAFDVIRRYLEYKGYKVTYVSNLTDVDDKTIRRAKERRISIQQLGEKYSDAYFDDLTKLGMKKPDINPRATQHIEEIIDLIQILIDKKYAYVVDGNVYYDISKFEDYGKLSGNKAEALEAGARIEVDPRKRNPADFALWKRQKSEEPAWNSPWGKGRPGWHIECSVMSMKYLGETLDIHAGGKDLIFPHHENEITQSEAATGKPFAKYWLHNEWLTVNGEKMSKSLGNFITAHEAIEKYGSQVVRLFLVSVHYRSHIDFNDRSLKQAKRNLEKLFNAMEMFEALREEHKSAGGKELFKQVEKIRQKFEEAMDDDFNTSLAVSALFSLTRKINLYVKDHGEIETEVKKKIRGIVKRLVEDVFGIKMERRKPETDKLVENLMKLIIEIRRQLRERGDWETADDIRAKLKALELVLEDTPKGTEWKIESEP
ncbi:MAG: cysteine--tRNA ligase [Candidatus Bathyarchaeota archaeon]|nr:MAG: cysteine--tRNA ligase [Candidatus Bathyarchaeota archaeon]